MDEDSAGARACESHASAEEETAGDVAIIGEVAPGSRGAGWAGGKGGALDEIDYKTRCEVSARL